MRKYLTWTALIGVVLTALLGILMIFSIVEFNNFKSYFFSCLTIAVGFSFALSSYNLYTNTKSFLPLISLSLIFVSIFLVILSLFMEPSSKVFMNLTITIAVISVFFSIIVANITKLGFKFLILQIVIYILVMYLLIIFILALWNVWNGFNTYFWVVAILVFSGLISLGVLSKKEEALKNTENSEEYVKITKNEYEYLTSRSKMFDDLMREKDQKL